MIPFRNAVKNLHFIRFQRANAHTGGRKLTSQDLQDQPDNIARLAREAERIQLLAASKVVGFDIWAQPVGLLDLRVPVPILTRGTTLQQIWAAIEHNLNNTVSNAIAMHRIAKEHSFPWDTTFSPFSYQIFRTKSTRSKTWLEPLRDIGLDAYKQLNTAIAKGQVSAIKQLTRDTYRRMALERMKALHKGRSKGLDWTLHSLASPVQCVSIRGLQGHFGKEELKFGTRWYVQACLKFDSWQSLAVRSSTTQPEPKRVLEYLVFEKKMWYNEPWTIRDQLWEAVHTKDSKQK
ncbi:hypothetical protein Clacol_000736 [Clathrus columnatus]|uniref:Uncharacterized protein n=1 Tax=Clathrus columnatus TaxID=1419009 RepID=A0AAV4ZZU3_9AGAM|nr:hypothetical protein Clacol_000736 [Clathrus columnatus]